VLMPFAPHVGEELWLASGLAEPGVEPPWPQGPAPESPEPQSPAPERNSPVAVAARADPNSEDIHRT
jgi:hypothetical protein